MTLSHSPFIHSFIYFPFHYFSLLGASNIAGIDGAKRRHIIPQTEDSLSIPNLEEGRLKMGWFVDYSRFFFPFFFATSLSFLGSIVVFVP